MSKSMRAFDLDHTLITSNISVDFGRYLYRRKIISFTKLLTLLFWYSRHKVLGLGIQELHKAVFDRLFKGILFKTIKDEVATFLKETPPHFFSPATLCIQPDSVILSSSPDFLVEPISKLLNIQFFKATTYAVDKEGRLCHISEVLEGAEKARELKAIADKRGLSKEQITYFTDSIWDLPVFEVAGTTIAVCPDKKLMKLAKKNQWEIIYESAFSRTG